MRREMDEEGGEAAKGRRGEDRGVKLVTNGR